MAIIDFNENPLELLGKTFVFQDLEPLHPSLAYIGSKRVVSLVVHESQPLELGLADDPLSEDIEYYDTGRLSAELP